MKKTIMVVEDDQDIRESIAELLADAQYEVVTAENGFVALERLKRGLNPDLILLDLMMPVMDGFTFRAEQLKNPEWQGTPVIVMSADGHIAEKQARAKANLYLKKPVDIDDLLKAVAGTIR